MSDHLENANRIAGWMSWSELQLLSQLASTAKRTIVEIGSYLGRSTLAIGGGSLSGNKAPVLAIDPGFGQVFAHDVKTEDVGIHEALVANIENAGLDSIVTVIRDVSANVAPTHEGAIDMLFIDALHDYESVKCNFYEWQHHVAVGGVACLHDYGRPAFPGVQRFVDTDETLRDDFEREALVDTLIALRRTRPYEPRH